MTDVYKALASSLALENNIDPFTATKIVTWFDHEGVLDYDTLKEIYLEDEQVLGG